MTDDFRAALQDLVEEVPRHVIPDDLTEAWATSPSTHPGVDCPIVVGSASGISRVCD